MTDPSGRSAPGEINNLLIWEQPHPLIFATYERRATAPDTAEERHVLEKWRDVIQETADWMAVFAFWNTSTNVYDIGPPMYVVSEDTSPNVTMNPAFELSYWRLGLGIATEWMQALGENDSVWGAWEDVRGKLAPLPVQNGTYAVYEGIPEDFWTDPEFTNDHPAMTGLYGWLPPTTGLDINIVNATTQKVWANWNISNCWGYVMSCNPRSSYILTCVLLSDGISPCWQCQLLAWESQSKQSSGSSIHFFSSTTSGCL